MPLRRRPIRGLEHRAVRSVEPRQAVHDLHRETLVVGQPVVSPAQQHEVLQCGRTTVGPVDNVVRIAPRGWSPAVGEGTHPPSLTRSAFRIHGGVIRVVRPTSSGLEPASVITRVTWASHVHISASAAEIGPTSVSRPPSRAPADRAVPGAFSLRPKLSTSMVTMT